MIEAFVSSLINSQVISINSTFEIYRKISLNMLLLRELSIAGSGVISTEYYNYGFFSASIKLPAIYTAGIVVAFYVSIQQIINICIFFYICVVFLSMNIHRIFF